MKKLFLIILAVAMGFGFTFSVQAAPPSTGDWALIWSDEFDSGSTPEYPNADNWGYESGYVRNNEWQYYTNELQNAYCQDGFLHIEAHQHPVGTYPSGTANPTYQDGSISSASLRSMGKREYKYGWIEMRGKIDTQLGSWPAFWSLGANGEWPDNGECDIMEYYQNALHFNVAWWKTGDARWTARWDSVSVNLSTLPVGWENEFHVWAMEWTPDNVNLYMDGVLYNTWDSSRDDNDASDSSIEGFQQEHYLILNQAIGGNAGGNASNLVYPTNYEVDYVRWYQNISFQTLVDDTDASIAYSGTWGTGSGNPGYQSTEHYSDTQGSEATFTFTGTKVAYYGFTRNDLGYAQILLDGQLFATVDCYSSAAQYNVKLYESPEIPFGEHTLTVRVDGTKNPASSGTEIIVDAFGYLAAPKHLYSRSDFVVNSVQGAASTTNSSEKGSLFTTGSTPVTITGLGFIDLNNTNPGVGPDGDGLLESHRVTLWLDSDDSKVTEVIVPSGTQGTLIDGFRWAGIPEGSLVLPANTTYVISADSYQTQDSWLDEEEFVPSFDFIGGNILDSTTWKSYSGTSGQKPDKFAHAGYVYGLANVTSENVTGTDNDPPTPNPASFASDPSADSDTAISMTATTGFDSSGPVEYLFTETSGNPGATSSAWQTSTSYTDSGLAADTQYTYTVTMRDSLGNTGTASSGASATTDAGPDLTPPNPDPMTWAQVPTPGSTTSGGGTMSASLTAPAVDGEDIANYGTVTGTDKWWPEATAAGSVKGQTFTTGVSAVMLNAITYQVTSSQKAEPTKTYVVRVGTVSGTTFTEIHSETFTQDFTWNGGEYMTWTLDTSVLLASNTEYGIDIGITSSTSTWQTGIPYINMTANEYAGGLRYTSGTLGIGTTTLALDSSKDRIFHIDMSLTGGGDPETEIIMAATTAADPSGVEYYFTETSGNPGGTDSGWQDSPTYVDTGLSPGTQYTYTVTARDKSVNQNTTAPSAPASATTAGAPVGDPVPDVVGMTQANAEAAIVAAGFTVGTVTTAYSDTVAVGDVISQSPTAGTPTAAGSPVDIEVSLGVQMVTVPDVVGLAQAAAESAITGAGLIAVATTDYSDTVPAGDVISQNPAASTSVAIGSSVDIVISLGEQMATVADVVGIAQAAAESAITAASLTVGTITTDYSDTVAVGDVISQNPTGGVSVAPGTSVDILVSLGVQMVTVPDVVGLAQVTAEANIVAAQLVVGTITTASSSTVPAGDVISQNPAGSSSAAIGSSVDLEVSTGPAPTLPAAPSSLSATAISKTEIDISWTDNATDETGFKIERSDRNNTNFVQIATVGANVTSFSDTGLKKNTTYYYRVRATNGSGDSAYSNEASATTPK